MRVTPRRAGSLVVRSLAIVAYEGTVMCGVFGYVGVETNVGDAVISALKTLEYRGYDSWGVAITTDKGLIVDKEPGRINGHRAPRTAGLFVNGHLVAGSRKPIADVREAIRVSKALRDRIRRGRTVPVRG